MAMNYYQASRAETPRILDAQIRQDQIAAQLRQAEMANRQGYITSGMMLAENAPEGSWQNLGNAIIGNDSGLAGGNLATQTAVDPTAGAMSSLMPEAATGTGGLEVAMGAQMTPAATGAAGAEAAAGLGTAAEAATAAEALAATEAATAGATAGGATAGGGVSAALGALGPVGWAALAAIALGAMQ